MKTKILRAVLPLLAVVTMLVGVPMLACQQAAPAPSAAPSAEVESESAKKLNVNYTWEIGNVLAESGFADWPKTAADPSATSTTAETAIGLIGPGPVGIAVSLCQFHTSAAMTADAANYATITVNKRTAGDAAVAIAQLNATSNWSAFNNINIPAVTDAGGAFVSSGDSITFAITKTGAGAVVPQGELACFTTIN